jgi:predicted PurR-regulated permease PerM
MTGYLQQLFFVLVITAFIQMEGAIYRRKLIAASGSRRTVRWLGEALGEVQRYLLVKLAVSAANGFLLGLWCWVWGIESPLLWGVAAFALNFIPYVGSLIAAVPPVLLGLMTGGLPIALAVASGYVAVNVAVDNILEPRIMGHTLGLSPLVILLSMLLWGFVLGPVGAILAVPLTMTAKILLERDKDLARIAVFLGDGSDLTPAKPA